MANRVLSALERAKLVCWFEETNSFVKVARRYQAEFGMKPPVEMAQIKKWHQNFLETGSVMPNKNIVNLHKTHTPVNPTYIFAENFKQFSEQGRF